jgi:hypothetical protein
VLRAIQREPNLAENLFANISRSVFRALIQSSEPAIL